jgi:polyhydroxybutyrate depolymerase
MVRLLITIAGVALLAGCTSPAHPAPGRPAPARSGPPAKPSPAPLGPGDHDLRMGARTYRLHVPAGLPAGPVPLVVGLHSALGSGGVMELLSRLDRVADRERFLVAYPDGQPAGARVWNAGDCCNRSRADDVGFLAGLIDHLVATQRADPARVYVTGVSNGAMMAYRLACQRAGKIAAIAPVAGAMTYQPCRPARRVPVMIFHGSADLAVPEAGGALRTLGMRGAFPSQAQIVRTWSRLNGVPEPDRISYQKGRGQRGGVVCRAAARDLVVYCRIAGGGHTWPGGTPVPAGGLTSMNIDASAAMWDFFKVIRR